MERAERGRTVDRRSLGPREREEGGKKRGGGEREQHCGNLPLPCRHAIIAFSFDLTPSSAKMRAVFCAPLAQRGSANVSEMRRMRLGLALAFVHPATNVLNWWFQAAGPTPHCAASPNRTDHRSYNLLSAVIAEVYPPHPLTGRSIKTQLCSWSAVTMAVCGHRAQGKVRKRQGRK